MLQRMRISLQDKKKRLLFFIVIAINILLCSASIINDLHYFTFENDFNEHTHELYLAIKCIWLISVVIIEYLIFLLFVYKKVIFQRYGIIFAINTVIYGIAFVCLYPGNWGGVGDELLVYWAAKNMWIWPQQGAMSGLVMIWQLMFYPATWMPILMQFIFTDIVFTRITGKLWSRGCKVTAVFFEVIIFSAVAMIYTYNPMRMWVLTVTFLAFLAEFYFAWTENKFPRAQQIYVCFLLCVIVCIRTETKYMLIWAPILLVLLFAHCKQIHAWKKIVMKIEMVAILSILMVSLIFGNLGGTAYRYNSLSVVSFVCPLSVILVSDDANLSGLEEEIAAINAVFPVRDLIDNPSATNFWNGKHWIDNYEDASKTEIRAFEKAALIIIAKNLDIFLKARYQMFIACMPQGGIYAASDIDAIKSWCENNHNTSSDLYKDFDFGNSLRMTGASLLSGISYIPFTIRRIQYSFIIPIVLLFFTLVFAIVKKKTEIVLILITAGIEFILMFLLIPNAANMYFVPYYILGWVMLGGFIEWGAQKVIEQQNKR